MSAFGAMDISASGMTAQRVRTDIIAQNIANVNSTRDGEGNVYRRRTVVFEEKPSNTFKDYLSVASSFDREWCKGFSDCGGYRYTNDYGV